MGRETHGGVGFVLEDTRGCHVMVSEVLSEAKGKGRGRGVRSTI